MAKYVDGFIVPVPKDKVEDYRRMSDECGKIWREHGALEYVEALADDVKVGQHTSFPQSVILKDDETVVFAWITYRSREERDQINEKVMKDPRMTSMMNPQNMVFDGKRLIFGGFKTIVER
jgi:uncharacterized protein YbaA (DUF1428 family)